MFSVGTATIGLAIYTFMAGTDLGYLDLKNELSQRSQVLCLTHWPLRGEGLHVWDLDGWRLWYRYRDDRQRYLKEHKCQSQSSNFTCGEVRIPLGQLAGKLGSPLGSQIKDQVGAHDIMGVYAHLFLIIAACMWLAISFHDHALLNVWGDRCKDHILDLNGMKGEFPRFKWFFRYLVGWRIVRVLLQCPGCRGKALGITILVLLLPVFLLWAIISFLFLIMPFVIVIFLCYPVRTSRLLILFLSIACIIYALALTCHTIVFLASEDHRPHYAVTWMEASRDHRHPAPCHCGCVYPVSVSTCENLLFVGLLAIIKSFVVAFRTLKGLRRSNWANLMSVTFAVPVNAYAVEWQQPDGTPIKHRQEGQPVQSELAFDPFAMMDEQPNSANTLVTLRPDPVVRLSQQRGQLEVERNESRWLQGPNIPSAKTFMLTYTEYIGCCGFPCRTGGYQGKFSFPDEDDENADKGIIEDSIGEGTSADINIEGRLEVVPVSFVPRVGCPSRRQVQTI